MGSPRHRSIGHVARLALALLVCGPAACGAAPVTSGRAGDRAFLCNGLVRAVFDLHTGTYDVLDASGAVAVRHAACMANEWSSAATNLQRSVMWLPAHDSLGAGRTMRVACAGAGRPTLTLDCTLYPGSDRLALAVAVRNTGKEDLRLTSFAPLAGARLFPGDRATSVRTLDGAGGAGDTRVTRGATRRSPNNLLLTYLSRGKRRSVVLGGLSYRDFCKTAQVGLERTTSSGRLGAVGKALPGATPVAYLDCGGECVTSREGVRLTLAQGSSFTWADASGDEPWYASVLFHDREVVLEASGLRPGKETILGLTWWDFDGNGRRQDVSVVGSDGVRRTLIPETPLPSGRAGRRAEVRAVRLPADATASGSCRIFIRNMASVPNAAVSEAWLWEAPSGFVVPARLAAGSAASAMVAPPGRGIAADLYAQDPVGRLIRPGEVYAPTQDRFYVGFGTPNPFVALERYGRAVRSAQGARPNPYTFPTVCAWYVGLFDYPRAQNQPLASKYGVASAPGLVEEAEIIRRSGFLRYAPAAVRLVPDTYAANNEQGWWDDEHWLRFGHYSGEFRTSAAYAEGVRKAGCLPFTYFQLGLDSADFRAAHPDWMLGGDPRRTLDYTHPTAQSHMRRVYANLRSAGVAGMMFDYPDSEWSGHLATGGFKDSAATAAQAYRTIFALAKEGLGPNSWVHERVLGDPLSDLTTGVIDSQRVWGDTYDITAQMVSRGGLRWYKNRVLTAYDMDAKNLLKGWRALGPAVSERDGRRMLLTMAATAASRLLLATSFRDMPQETLHDLERTFPYHRQPVSARPVDMLTSPGWPRIYDFVTGPGRRVVTLYNNREPARADTLTLRLAGDPAEGALGVPGKAMVHIYDFWNERYLGLVPASRPLAQALRPGEARVLAITEDVGWPRVIGTNRHILQGYVDLAGEPVWDARGRTLSGAALTVAGETFRILIARSDHPALDAACSAGGCRVVSVSGAPGLAALEIDAPAGGNVRWRVRFGPRAASSRR
ncbi:MAG: hypothetical protein NT029_20565 [Armatimonadetes bacterium]|nr:hypothetical protein [Armatimonadota bacterium]